MSASSTEFETFQKQLTDIVGELQSVILSEARLREEVRLEAARAEAAEADSAMAKRDAADCRAGAAAAAAGAEQASTALASVQNELCACMIKLELTERQRNLLEDKCSEMTERIGILEREVQELRPLQSANSTLERQYMELEGHVRVATEEARKISSDYIKAKQAAWKLSYVEWRGARGGAEVRERARLAAAAHARERRLAAAELQHTARELLLANAEVARLGSLVSELQCRLSVYEHDGKSKTNSITDTNSDTIAEIRAILESERAGAAKIERALAAALADNATLAAQIHTNDNPVTIQDLPLKENTTTDITTNICPIDLFLADQ